MSNEYKPTYVDNADNSISIMESTDTISFCKTGTKINTLSAKNVAHKKTGEDLNLCAYDGSSFNPVITINNNNQDCRIMTNLNIAGNLNINSTACINLPVGTEALRPANPIPGTIRYNNDTHMFEGYCGYGLGSWVNLSPNPNPPLYTFTSHTFTNCGATGRYGPTLAQMTSAYSGTTWANTTEFFNSVNQGYQIWTVPQTGDYQIKAYGAMGGENDNTGIYMGKGAWTQGDFNLSKGTQLLIIVGQQGVNAFVVTADPVSTRDPGAGGGGGATWVLRAGETEAIDSNLYCVAGGGGGEMRSTNQPPTGTISDAPSSQSGPITDWNSVQSEAGYIFKGGGGGSYGINGKSGHLGYGLEAAGISPYDSKLSVGGIPLVNGGMSVLKGGFGGGGAGFVYEGGGGGGYIGGNASQSAATTGGHGGSSRNNGSSISFGNHSNSNGSVEITII